MDAGPRTRVDRGRRAIRSAMGSEDDSGRPSPRRTCAARGAHWRSRDRRVDPRGRSRRSRGSGAPCRTRRRRTANANRIEAMQNVWSDARPAPDVAARESGSGGSIGRVCLPWAAPIGRPGLAFATGRWRGSTAWPLPAAPPATRGSTGARRAWTARALFCGNGLDHETPWLRLVERRHRPLRGSGRESPDAGRIEGLGGLKDEVTHPLSAALQEASGIREVRALQEEQTHPPRV